jgi:hypothetical protein
MEMTREFIDLADRTISAGGVLPARLDLQTRADPLARSQESLPFTARLVSDERALSLAHTSSTSTVLRQQKVRSVPRPSDFAPG